MCRKVLITPETLGYSTLWFIINYKAYFWHFSDIHISQGSVVVLVEETIRMTEDSDKWRKYVHGVANTRIEDG